MGIAARPGHSFFDSAIQKGIDARSAFGRQLTITTLYGTVQVLE